VGVGGIIDGLSHLYDWFVGPGEDVLGWWDRLDGKVVGTAHHLGKDVPDAAGTGVGSVSSGARTAGQAVQDLNAQVDTLAGNILGLDDANVRVGNDFARLKTGIKGGADALDINTQKGRDNRAVLDGLVGDLERQRAAAIRAGHGTKEAMDNANAAF